MTMSDRIAVMKDGIIEQIDKPAVIYQKPATRFVADFIGESNIFEGVVESADADVLRVKLPGGTVSAAADPDRNVQPGETVWVSVRPEAVQVSAEPVEGFDFPAVVTDRVYIGTLTKVMLSSDDGQEIRYSSIEESATLRERERVYLSWKMEKAVVIRKG